MPGRPRGLIEQLGALLDDLQRSRNPVFAITPREAVDAHQLVLALVARGVSAQGIAAFTPYLAPLLTRNGDERRAFDTIIGAIEATVEDQELSETPEPDQQILAASSDPPPLTWREWLAAKWQRVPREVTALVLFVVFAVVVASLGLSSKQQKPGSTAETTTAAQKPKAQASGTAVPSRPKPQDAPDGDTSPLTDAVERHDGAPTLREIARTRAPQVSFEITEDEYLRRLQALVGGPADRPLSGFPALWSDLATSAPQTSARQIGWALAQIEMPGQRPHLSDIGALPQSHDAARRSAFRQTMATVLPGLPAGNASTATVVAAFRTAWKGDGKSEPATWDDERIARMIAVLRPDWTPADAPWLPQARHRAALPWWSSWLVAVLVLTFLAMALLPLLDPRRAFLRLRPPLTQPHRTALVRDAGRQPLGRPAVFRDVHRALQQRAPRLTRTMDLRATIHATIRNGGRVVLRSAVVQARPDYLVLIERRSLHDLEAQRALAMIAPLRTGAIGLDVYFFEGDPSFTRSERNGRTATIQELVARFPNHRLLLITDGEKMLDLFSGRLRAGYAQLGHWRRRGLLTPVPHVEWAREEVLIARGLGGPLAQLSDIGMLGLARQLPQEMRAGAEFPEGHTEGTPMPRALAMALARVPEWIAQRDEAALDALVADLAWYPDGPGFEWLCAMAVYPIATFDLALYLGTRMELQVGVAGGHTVFTPLRLAALTRLDWLRTGRIPDPIRRRLVARLSPERALQVRGLIRRLLEQAEAEPLDSLSARAAYGREQVGGPPPDRLFEDEVLVDFMRKGEVEEQDMPLPDTGPMDWRERWRQVDWLMTGAVAVVWGYAAAAWFATPGADEYPGDPLAWLPLALVGLCAVSCVVLLRPVTIWLRLRDMAWQFATGGLVTALLAASMLAERFGLGGLEVAGSPLLASSPLLARLMLAILSWPLCWWAFGLFARDGWSPALRIGAIAKLAVQAVVGGIAAVTVAAFAASLGSAAPFALGALIVAGPLVAHWASRLVPVTRVAAQPDLRRLRHAGPFARRAPFGVALGLLVACLWWAHQSDRAREPLVGTAVTSPVMATTPEGLVAMTQGQGNSVGIVSAYEPGRWLKWINVRDLRTGAASGQAGHRSLGGVTAIALTGAPASGARAALATADGTVLANDGRRDWHFVAARLSASSGVSELPAAAPVLGLGEGDMLLAARLFDSGLEIAVSNQATQGSSAVNLPQAPRMTAVAAVPGGCFLWTLANGEIGALRVEGTAARPRIALLGPHPGWRYERLAGGARLIRRLSSKGAVTNVLVVADDGTAASVVIDCKGGFGARRVKRIDALALGDMPAWRDRAVSSIVTPAAAPAVNVARTVQTPCVRSTSKSAPSRCGDETITAPDTFVAAQEAVSAAAASVVTLPYGAFDFAVVSDQLICVVCNAPMLATPKGRQPMSGRPTAIVVHDTAGPATGNAPSLATLERGVSNTPGPLAHLLIGRDGTVYQLLRFNYVAPHVGKASGWDGIAVSNGRSIGIELEHAGDEPYPAVQTSSALNVIRVLMSQYAIRTVVGHGEVALPRSRKSDPRLDMKLFRRSLGLPATEKAQAGETVDAAATTQTAM